MKKVILYYADWCGHCTHFKPVWKALKNVFMNLKSSRIVFMIF